MHCFNHQASVAVGACSYCLKGLCQGCMQEVVGRFSCSGQCAVELEKIKTLNNCAMNIYGIDSSGAIKKPGLTMAKLYAALGVPFLGFGIYSALTFGDWGIACFASVSGLVCIVHAYKIYKRGLRL